MGSLARHESPLVETNSASSNNPSIHPPAHDHAAPADIGSALMDALRSPDDFKSSTSDGGTSSDGINGATALDTATGAATETLAELSFDFNHFASPTEPSPRSRLWSDSSTPSDPLLSSLASPRTSDVAPIFDPKDLLDAMAPDDDHASSGGGAHACTAGSGSGARARVPKQRKSSTLEDDGVVGAFEPIEIHDAYFPHPRLTEVKDFKPESFFPRSIFSVQVESTSVQVQLRCGQMFGQAHGSGGGAARWQDEVGDGPLIFQATGIVAVYDEFPSDTDTEYVSRLLVVAHSVDVIDRLDGSHGNKFLTAIDTQEEPRESSTEMVRIDYVTVRTPRMAENAGI